MATKTIVVVLIALACWASGGANAMAHTALRGSDPADGATTSTAPRVVTLTFTEEINPAFASIVVNGSDGRDWTSGPPRATGPTLQVPVRPDIPAGGEYEVGYRVVSEDGHPVTGSITFTIVPATRGAASPAPPPTTPLPNTPEPADSGPLGSDSRTSVVTAAVGGLLIGGVIAFWQSRRHRRRDSTDPTDTDPTD